MNGSTRFTSRLRTFAGIEKRTFCRAALDSPGGGSRSLLCRLADLSPPLKAPRSAPSTRSGSLAKVISPSSDAKTAPPIRAAPQRPVKIVPLNHCTETRRRSITAASEPSTDSGGSWPRSMTPTDRLKAPPRTVLEFKPPSPAIASFPTLRLAHLPRGVVRAGNLRAHRSRPRFVQSFSNPTERARGPLRFNGGAMPQNVAGMWPKYGTTLL